MSRLIKKLRGSSITLRVCYEAGPCGYALYWQFAEMGIPCEVVAPTLIPVRSGDRVSIRVTGRVTGVIGDHAEPLAIRVRSLRTGSVVYVSGARRLHVSLDALGPFEVELTLQANLPAGNYMLEAGAQDLLTHRDFAAAPSALFRVTDSGTFRGSVQLNATMQVVARSLAGS